jgi:hypothetical protein
VCRQRLQGVVCGGGGGGGGGGRSENAGVLVLENMGREVGAGPFAFPYSISSVPAEESRGGNICSGS